MSKLTIVMPLYNKEEHIVRAINSVLAQTIQDFEMVVVDDGSTDRGADIVKSVPDSRIRLIQQANAGVSAARNRGIKESKAGLIAFLDADDAWRPLFLETVYRLKEKYPQAGAYATAYEIKEANGKISVPKYKSIPGVPWEGLIPNYFESALGDPPVCSSATAVPKKVFDHVGLFPEGVKIGEDLDMWLRIALCYRFAYSTVVGSCYHKEASNRICLTEQRDENVITRTALAAIEGGKVSRQDSLLLYEYINKKNIEMAVDFIVKGRKEKAIQILRSCDTARFRREKLKWSILSRLPYHILQLLLFIKTHWINKLQKRSPGPTASSS